MDFKGVQANADGWVALGLSLDGAMSSGGVAPGSDIFMGFLNTAVPNCDAGCINDYSTLFYALPILDNQQNLDFVSFSARKKFFLHLMLSLLKENGVTSMEFG